MATFHDIIGQEQIKEHLQNAISAKKISHAYIINGEKSSGKEFIARVFAMPCSVKRAEPSLVRNAIPVSRRCRTTSRTLSMSAMRSPIPSV